MTLKEKVGTVTGILTVMGIAISINLWVDARYAKAADLEKLEVQTVNTMRDFRVQQMVRELNGLEVKETTDGLTKYDELRQKQLERDLELEIKSDGHD